MRQAAGFLSANSRAEEAEAKLAHIEKPIGYVSKSFFESLKIDRFHSIAAYVLRESSERYSEPLYTAPVASDVDLRAENDKLRQAAKPFAEYGLDYFDKDNTGSPLPDEQGVGCIYLNYGHFRALCAALNPSEPRT